MAQTQQDIEAQQARIMADLHDFWRVEDNLGNDYGTFDRYTATILWDRLKREHPDRQVGITKVEPVGSCH